MSDVCTKSAGMVEEGSTPTDKSLLDDEFPIDREPMYNYVAFNLLNNLGPRAHDYAVHALMKMTAMGDLKGRELWLGIQAALDRVDVHRGDPDERPPAN